MKTQKLIDEYLPFTCISDHIKKISLIQHSNHQNKTDANTKASIFLQTAMMTAINRSVKDITKQNLLKKNPEIMTLIKNQYSSMIHSFEQSEKILVEQELFKATYNTCKTCN
jgi:hypothetical protein